MISVIDRAPFSGDAPLGARQARAYFAHAWRELLADREPQGVSQAIPAAVVPRDARSPFRVYAETVLCDAIRDYAPNPVAVVDIGCGSGKYAAFFHGRSGVYHGVDVERSPRWDDVAGAATVDPLTIRFSRMAAESLRSLDHAFTFSFSSSSLEHIADPQAAIQALHARTRPGTHGVHIVPAPWSILAYGQHGWRRFSAEQLEGLFAQAGFERVALYRLGGVPSLLLHIAWIAGLETGWALQSLTFSRLPFICYHVARRIRYRRARTGALAGRVYGVLLRLALRLDRVVPRMPLGYAIVVRRAPASDAV